MRLSLLLNIVLKIYINPYYKYEEGPISLVFDQLNLADAFWTFLELFHNYDYYIYNVNFKLGHNYKMLKWMDSCSRS